MIIDALSQKGLTTAVLNRGAAEPLGAVRKALGVPPISEFDTYLLVNCS